MNQNFFNFPTSWVAEMNKQAQPKLPVILQAPIPPAPKITAQDRHELVEQMVERMAPRRKGRPAAPVVHDLDGHQVSGRRGRPPGSKNKPKPSTVRKVDTE